MKLSHGLAAVVLALSAAAAQADVSATITAVSDYDFRGLTQTRQNPALQGSIDITGKSGWYLGAWASNVDFGGDENVEVDLYGGFAGGETFPWDIGIIDYTYPQSNDLRDFPEIYASLGLAWLKGKVWYSDNFGGSHDDAILLRRQRRHPAARQLRHQPARGLQRRQYWGNAQQLLRLVGRRDLLDRPFQPRPEVGRRQRPQAAQQCLRTTSRTATPRAIFSISTTFPWSHEEESTPEIAEAAPVAAAAPAAPADADGDGVPDATDRCPNTPAGDRVGPNGCSCDVSIQTHFAFDSADLTAEDKAALDKSCGPAAGAGIRRRRRHRLHGQHRRRGLQRQAVRASCQGGRGLPRRQGRGAGPHHRRGCRLGGAGGRQFDGRGSCAEPSREYPSDGLRSGELIAISIPDSGNEPAGAIPPAFSCGERPAPRGDRPLSIGRSAERSGAGFQHFRQLPEQFVDVLALDDERRRQRDDVAGDADQDAGLECPHECVETAQRRVCPGSPSSSMAPIRPRLRRSITCGRPFSECTASAQ